ncbi:MAG: UvrD-helicase domain-containing protein [Candidatus Rifleibacteriota bacterium]
MNNNKNNKISSNLLSGLTSEQVSAVTCDPEGRLRISAGAGSGKTEVLTRRIAALLEKGIKPEELVAITYTQKAAGEMKTRLVQRRKISPAILREMKVATFHAFLADLLKKDPFGAGIDRSDTVVPENERKLILAELKEKFARLHGQEIIDGSEKLGASVADRLINEFPDALGKIRRYLLTPGEFYQHARAAFKQRSAPVDDIEKNTLEWLFRFSTYFLEELRKRNLLDFDEILIRGRSLVKEMVEANEFPAAKTFLIDEFQDNNPDQLGIVNLFLDRPDGHISVVGDEKQSIYRFQGADISTFKNFKSDTDIVLTDNFRSYCEILDFADSFLALKFPGGKLSVPQTARRGESPRKPAVLCLTTPDEKNEEDVCKELAAFIKSLITSGMSIKSNDEKRRVQAGDIAIILSSVKSLPRSFEDSLAEEKIPYIMSGGFSFYARSEIEEILAFLKLIVMPEDDFSLVKILTGPLYGLNDSDLAALSLKGRNEKVALLPHILASPKQELPSAAVEFRKLYVILKNKSAKSSLLELCHTILEQAGFLEYAATQNSEIKRRRMENNLSKFLAIVRNFEQKGIFTSLRDFLQYIEKILLSGIDEDEAGLGLEEGDAVKIMTIHKSKGLEFPIVICPFLKAQKFRVRNRIFFDRQYGLMVKDPDKKGKEAYSENLKQYVEGEQEAEERESRRKLYVAFTRAQDILITSGQESRSFEPEDKEKASNEPLAEIRDILSNKPELGKITSLDTWPEIVKKWLEAGAIESEPEIIEETKTNDLTEIKSELEAFASFLSIKNEDGKTEQQSLSDIFSLQDLSIYRNCPRKYFFLSRHISTFRESEPNLFALAGTIFHESVRIFHNRNGHELQNFSEKQRFTQAILDDLCQLHQKEGEEVKPRVERLIDSYLQSKLSSIKPWMTEAEVNLKFNAPSGSFYLRGFADRVDNNDEGINIIDFKTRTFDEKAHQSYADQLALYLIAAQRGVLGQIGCLNFPRASIAYINPVKLEIVDLKADLIDFEKRAIQTVEQIRKDNSWLPGDESTCDTCGFAVLCNEVIQTT